MHHNRETCTYVARCPYQAKSIFLTAEDCPAEPLFFPLGCSSAASSSGFSLSTFISSTRKKQFRAGSAQRRSEKILGNEWLCMKTKGCVDLIY